MSWAKRARRFRNKTESSFQTTSAIAAAQQSTLSAIGSIVS